MVKIVGELEIDCERGVIYFHFIETGATVLRICQLPVPIPASGKFPYFLDVTHMSGTSWDGIRKTIKSEQIMPYDCTDVVVDPPAPYVEFKGWEPQGLVSVGGFKLIELGDEEKRLWQKLYRYGEERARNLGLKEEDIERLVDKRR